MKFYPVKTQDGSVGLYNNQVNDIYHSSYGAYSEALEKFIKPSGLLEFVKKNSSIRILDICYGVGYNTKASIEKILELNPCAKIIVDCLEADPEVLAFSILMQNKYENFGFYQEINLELFKNEEISRSFINFIENNKFSEFYSDEILNFINHIQNKGLLDHIKEKKSLNLHNIYYEYVSGRNIQKDIKYEKRSNLSILMHLGDARSSIGSLNGNYDFIFLDAFTPIKLPTLWSVEFFEKLSSLLTKDGNLTTYTNSAAVRGGMIEAGLNVGRTKFGTIASKNSNLVSHKLTTKDIGLIQTRAGIPFRDEFLNASPDEILKLRKLEVDKSDRCSSSSFLKNFKN